MVHAQLRPRSALPFACRGSSTPDPAECRTLTGSPLLRPAELLASQLETFNFRAFNGLVTLPIAVATGQLPPARLSPAGSAASVPHTVSGFTIRSDLRQPGNHRLAQIQNCRSVLRLRVPAPQQTAAAGAARRLLFGVTQSLNAAISRARRLPVLVASPVCSISSQTA